MKGFVCRVKVLAILAAMQLAAFAAFAEEGEIVAEQNIEVRQSEAEAERREFEEFRAARAAQKEREEFERLVNERVKQEIAAMETVKIAAPKEPNRRFALTSRMIFVGGGDNKTVSVGPELGFGNLKRNGMFASGIVNLASRFYYKTRWSDNYYYGGRYVRDDSFDMGWGAGVFFGNTIPIGEHVKFIPGLNTGFWIYTIDDFDEIQLYWSGGEVRFLVGAKAINLDVFFRVLVGMKTDGYYGDYRDEDYGTRSGFAVKPLWGVGITFLNKK